MNKKINFLLFFMKGCMNHAFGTANKRFIKAHWPGDTFSITISCQFVNALNMFYEAVRLDICNNIYIEDIHDAFRAFMNELFYDYLNTAYIGNFDAPRYGLVFNESYRSASLNLDTLKITFSVVKDNDCFVDYYRHKDDEEFHKESVSIKWV